MIVTLPFVPGATDYKQLVTDFRKRGPAASHPLRVISRADDADEAYDLGQELVELFGPATFHGVTIPENHTGRIRIANDLFFAAMTWLGSQKPEKGGSENPPLAIYLDPTYRPTRNDWLRDLQSAYYYAGAPPVFGQVVVAPDGERAFVGPVVVSAAFPKASALLNFLPDTIHWRVYLRSEMLRSFVATDLIGSTPAAVLKAPAKPKKA